jgi:uncharacterized BrkB/YihY/UPF0761 family membrane protein
MEQDPKNIDPKELARQKRIENQEKAMDMMFGKNRHIYAGNIWGWRFSIISLLGILLVVVFMIIGIMSGNINLNDQVQQAKEAKEAKESKLKRDSIPDSK